MSLYNNASISADHTIIYRIRVLECFAKMKCLPVNSSSSVLDFGERMLKAIQLCIQLCVVFLCGCL